jgi:actin-related protein
MVSYFLKTGQVENFETLEKIFNYTLNDLKVDMKDNKLFLVDNINNKVENREKMGQILFEKFEIPSLYISNQSYLSFTSFGLFNGFLLDSVKLKLKKREKE